MIKQEINKFIGLIIFGLTITYLPVQGQSSSKGEKMGETVTVKDKNIDWEAFDTTSSISQTNIKSEDMQGLWNAYKGVYRFGDKVNAMELTKPFIFEVKGNTYRRNEKSDFKNFSLKDNLIIKVEESKVDTGIINKITPTEIIISWKKKSDYTRYYYKK